MAVVAALLALVWTRLPSPRGPARLGRPSPTLEPAPETLLYVADVTGKPHRQEIWKVDVASGLALPGPMIPRSVELVGASFAGSGRVGITAVGRDGRVVAYVLDGTTLADVPTRLGSGEEVAWGPLGQVAIARSAPVAGGCRKVTIDLIQVEDGSRERIFTEPHLCGDLASLGRDGALTYFTRVTKDGVEISFVGIAVARTILRGFEMLSVSPASDFLVVRANGPSPPVMYWRGTGAPATYQRGGRPLVGGRALAWSPDSSRAAVAGRLGSQAGIFLVNAGAGDVRRVPRLVVLGRAGLGAAFSNTGVLYVAANGHLYRYTEWLSGVRLPKDAPPPAGPMAWLT